MSSNEENPPEVRLSALKIRNLQISSDQDEPKFDTQKPLPSPTHPTGNIFMNQHPFDFRRPGATAGEYMATDKLGEEMADNAAIWKLYLEEAAEHDQELVKGRHVSLDMLLLFVSLPPPSIKNGGFTMCRQAALFSAILTAFLIESKNLLQQDPADASLAVLLLIAQSQQRMELGLPPPEPSPSVDSPPFRPPNSARWINGIWFTSLALSLSAALVAMLGKEWLTAYLASRPRPAHKHALVRQGRLEGLERWWALHIIALLPSLLHASLLLFSVGLVIYLSTLDTIVAGFIAGFVGITTLFYVITAIQGAVYDDCPYVTQISWYLKIIGAAYLGRLKKAEESHSSSIATSLKDIRALLWLANNARDPAVVECAFQALAGLHLPNSPSQSSATSLAGTNSDSSSGQPDDIPMQLDRQTTLDSLLGTVCQRFEILMRNHLELSTAGGANAVERYISTITGLSSYLDMCRRYSDGVPKVKAGNHQSSAQADNATNGNPFKLLPSIMRSLDILKQVWSEESPGFTIDAYTGFLVNELALLRLAASNLKQDSMPDLVMDAQAPTYNAEHIIEMHPASLKSSIHQLSYLQARHSHTLSRASALLSVHTNNQALIGNHMLNRLLDEMSSAAKCEALHPSLSIGAHYRPPNFIIPLSNRNECRFSGLDLIAGPLGSLIRLQKNSSHTEGKSVLQMRCAVVRAFSALAPVLLQPLLSSDRNQLVNEFDLETWPNSQLLDHDEVRYVAARQLFLLLRLLGPQLQMHEAIEKICCEAMILVTNYLRENVQWDVGARLALRVHGGDLGPILDSAGASDSHLQRISTRLAARLIDLVQIVPCPGEYDDTVCDTLLPPSSFPPLLNLIERSNQDTEVVQELVEAMLRRIRATDHYFQRKNIVWNNIRGLEYLHVFTRSAQGFFALAHVAPQNQYSSIAIDAIFQITHLAAGRDPKLEVTPIELCTAAVPSFLDVVSIVAEHCSGATESTQQLLEFSQEVVDLLRVASNDPESRPLIAGHSAHNELSSALRAIGENSDAQNVLVQLGSLRDQFVQTDQGDNVTSNNAQDESRGDEAT